MRYNTAHLDELNPIVIQHKRKYNIGKLGHENTKKKRSKKKE